MSFCHSIFYFPKDKNYSIVMKIPLHKTCVTEAPFRKQHEFYQKLKTWAKFLLVYCCKHQVSRREVLGKGPKPPQVTSIFPECLLGTACLSHGPPCARIYMSGKQKLSKSNIKKSPPKKHDNWLATHINHQKTGWCKSRNMVFSSWTRGHLFWAKFLGNICGSPGWCYYNYITLWSFNVVMENHHV